MNRLPEPIEIDVDTITVPEAWRRIDEAKVAELAESIEAVGLLNPVSLIVGPDGEHMLIAGKHRLRAHQLLGRETIRAQVFDLDEDAARLATIDENLRRNAGSALERGDWLVEGKRLHLRLHPETGHGGSRASGHGDHSGSERFTAGASKRTGASERTVRRQVKTSERLDDSVRDAVASALDAGSSDGADDDDTRRAARAAKLADSPGDLLKLSKLPAHEQAKVVERVISGESKGVSSRRPLDAYYTPNDLASALVSLLPVRGDVVEPHIGGGAFARQIKTHHGVVPDGADKNPGAAGRADCTLFIHGDWLNVIDRRWRWAIGNPPFSEAEAHVRHALSCCDNVAFLLRLAFLESQERIPFWKEHPARKVWVLSERPSFTGDGTDSCAYGFFWWERGFRGPTELDVISWR